MTGGQQVVSKRMEKVVHAAHLTLVALGEVKFRLKRCWSWEERWRRDFRRRSPSSAALFWHKLG